MARWTAPEYMQRRPDHDTVPLIDCEHAWCGGKAGTLQMEPGQVVVLIDGDAQVFCSAGCASRWLIRYELRANPPAPVVQIERPRVPAKGRSESYEIREWARAHGIPVAAKGYLSPALVAQYREAHR